MLHSLPGCKAPLWGACISKTDLHTHTHHSHETIKSSEVDSQIILSMLETAAV